MDRNPLHVLDWPGKIDSVILDAVFGDVERWQVAAHEAGHAVAAARLGVGFLRVSIKRDGDEFGRVIASGAQCYPKQRLKQDVVTMAGPIAEEALGRDDHSRSVRTEWAVDFEGFRADASRGERAAALAAALIQPDLDVVKCVACRLVGEVSLSGKEVRQMARRLALHTWPAVPATTDASARIADVVAQFFRRALDEPEP